MRHFPYACAWLLVIASTPACADPPPASDKLIVATWNVEWLFDENTGDNYADLAKAQSAPTRADWDWKLAGVAKVISQIRPTILALQEVENQRQFYLTRRRLKQEHGQEYTGAYVEGGDFCLAQHQRDHRDPGQTAGHARLAVAGAVPPPSSSQSAVRYAADRIDLSGKWAWRFS